jgi:hypothetical protein
LLTQIVEVQAEKVAARDRGMDVRILEARHDGRSSDKIPRGTDALTYLVLRPNRDNPIALNRQRARPASRRVAPEDVTHDHKINTSRHATGR